jgi:hypothetical protein
MSKKKTKPVQSVIDIDAMVEDMLGDSTKILENKPLRPVCDGELLFFLQLDDAYYFRNMFDYLRGPNPDANLVFTANGLEYTCVNGKETILNHFTIAAPNITYSYNTAYESIVVGINLNIFTRTTHNIGKKESFRLFMRKGEGLMYYEILSITQMGVSISSSGKINIKDVPVVEHRMIEPRLELIRKTVYVNQFCHACLTLANVKCNRIRVVGYEHGFKLEGMDNYNQTAATQRFYPPKISLVENSEACTIELVNNSIDVDMGKEVCRLFVSVANVKWFGKLTNVSVHGDRFNISYSENEPMCVSGNMGFFAKFQIYIKDEPR